MPIRPLARGSVLKLWLALIVLVVAGAALAWVGTAPLQIVTTATGVRFQTLRAGTGRRSCRPTWSRCATG